MCVCVCGCVRLYVYVYVNVCVYLCVCVYVCVRVHVTAGAHVDNHLSKLLNSNSVFSLPNFFLFNLFFYIYLFRWMTWTTSTQYILKKLFDVIENKKVILQHTK